MEKAERAWGVPAKEGKAQGGTEASVRLSPSGFTESNTDAVGIFETSQAVVAPAGILLSGWPGPRGQQKAPSSALSCCSAGTTVDPVYPVAWSGRHRPSARKGDLDCCFSWRTGRSGRFRGREGGLVASVPWCAVSPLDRKLAARLAADAVLRPRLSLLLLDYRIRRGDLSVGFSSVFEDGGVQPSSFSRRVAVVRSVVGDAVRPTASSTGDPKVGRRRGTARSRTPPGLAVLEALQQRQPHPLPLDSCRKALAQFDPRPSSGTGATVARDGAEDPTISSNTSGRTTTPATGTHPKGDDSQKDDRGGRDRRLKQIKTEDGNTLILPSTSRAPWRITTAFISH